MIEWDPFEIQAAKSDNEALTKLEKPDNLLEVWPTEIPAQTQEYLGFTLNQKRLWGIFIIFGLSLGIIFYRAYTMQIIQGDYYRGIAEGNRLQSLPIKAPRGLIYDAQMRPLVKNIPSFSLTAIPKELPTSPQELDSFLGEIAETISETNTNEFISQTKTKLLQSPKKHLPIILKENIPYQTATLIKIKSRSWPGITLNIERIRQYETSQINEDTVSHILGYLGRVTEEDFINYGDQYQLTDQLGKAGLEQTYEKILKGVDGRERVEVDALGKTKKVIAKESPVAGGDLILAVNIDVQKKLTEILKAGLTKSKKTRAAAIALNPNNGQIIAAVSLPTYDNNLFARGITTEDYQKLVSNPDHPLFNRVVSGEYPSGSTFKPFVAAAALEETLISGQTVFNSVGGIRINQWFFPDWKAGGHGYTNVTKALAWSVNTFFYLVGGGNDHNIRGLGVSKIIRYAKAFGFGQSLGVDLLGEKDGFLPTPEWKELVKEEPWYIGDTYHLAIGQGDLLVTPIQLAAATSAIANNGTVYKPQFVKAIKRPESMIAKTEEILNQNFINPENLAIVKQGLREAVIYGSARQLGSLPVSAAGKTGTAQWHPQKPPHAWFTGFAPFKNPKIVVTVIIEEGEEGSTTAVPLAGQFISWFFQNNVDKTLD